MSAELELQMKAHGMEGSLEEPDWPALTLAEVDLLLAHYPEIGPAQQLLSISPRPFSAASVVEARPGRVFVKRHALAVRDREGLLEEHRFQQFLSKAYVDDKGESFVQAPFADKDGETAIRLGEWTYEVHPVARGLDVYEQALSWSPFQFAGHAYEAGRAMARMHLAAEGYDALARKTRQLVTSDSIFVHAGGYEASSSPESRMAAYLQERPTLEEYAEKRDWRDALDRVLMPCYEKLAPWLPSLKPLWTHNDFHASNLMWSGAGTDARVSAVIDFGLSDRTSAVHDLATAIERNIVDWLAIKRLDANESKSSFIHYDHLDALLSGYHANRPLSSGEARALAAVMPLVHCEFASSETDYFLSVLHSEEKAKLAYEGYFLAHAEWFQSTQGRQLLDYLEKWADTLDDECSERR